MFYFALPLGVEHRSVRFPIITVLLLSLNVVVFGLSLVLQSAEQHLWLIPANSGWWTFLTSLFVSANVSLLLGSMIYLFLFGACMEDLMGPGRFAAFYLVGGMLGNLAQVGVTPGHFTSTIALGGPAGAITSCMGAFLILLTKARIEFQSIKVTFPELSISTGTFYVPAWIIISVWLVADGVMAVLAGTGQIQDEGMMFMAQAVGFVWGLSVAGIMRLISSGNTASQPGKATANLSNPRSEAGHSASLYLLINQNQSGPYTPHQVREMLTNGSLPLDTQYWREGMQEWRSLEELRGGEVL